VESVINIHQRARVFPPKNCAYPIYKRDPRLQRPHISAQETYCFLSVHVSTQLQVRGALLQLLSTVCCSVLQCVAVCCSVLQCVVVCCSVLQCLAVCCSVVAMLLQCCCNVVAECCRVLQSVLQRITVHYSVLQFVAMGCSMLQYVAVCCSMLQRVACWQWRCVVAAGTATPFQTLTRSLLLSWQASPPSKVRSEVANPVVSTVHRQHSSQIPKALSVSSVVTPPRHRLPALLSDIGHLSANRY